MVSIILINFFNKTKGLKAKLPGGVELSTGNHEKQQLPVNIPELSAILPDIKDFFEHNYFNLLRKVHAVGVVTTLGNPLKEDLISSFMQYFAKIASDIYSDWLKETVETEGKTLQKAIELNTIILEKIRVEAELAIVKLNFKNKVYTLKGYPTIFVNKFISYYRLFADQLADQYSRVYSSLLHPSWQAKTVAILDITESLFRLHFIGVSSAVMELNGEIDAYIENEIKKLP